VGWLSSAELALAESYQEVLQDWERLAAQQPPGTELVREEWGGGWEGGQGVGSKGRSLADSSRQYVLEAAQVAAGIPKSARPEKGSRTGKEEDEGVDGGAGRGGARGISCCSDPQQQAPTVFQSCMKPTWSCNNRFSPPTWLLAAVLNCCACTLSQGASPLPPRVEVVAPAGLQVVVPLRPQCDVALITRTVAAELDALAAGAASSSTSQQVRS